MAEATKTLNLIEQGKNKNLMSLVPDGLSPKLYLDLVKGQVMTPAINGTPRSDEDLLMFLYVCKRTGLDPLTKQIFAVFRWDGRTGADKMTIQAGIDGMRLVAQRSGAYAGQDDVKFAPENESAPHPIKATVTVYKLIGGQKVGFTATARWNEYLQVNKKGEPMGLWVKMPYNQLGKCAEALALRKGFPNELSGIYAEEEMAQASNPLAGLTAPVKTEPEKIEVVHGAPADITPIIGTSEAAEQPKVETPIEENPKEPNYTVKKSVAEMREQIKIMAEKSKEGEKVEPEIK